MAKIPRLDSKSDGLRTELLAEIRPSDTRIDALDRELRMAIDVRQRLVLLEAELRT